MRDPDFTFYFNTSSYVVQPLTTVFTAPAACEYPFPSSFSGPASCVPENWVSAAQAPLGYYSPGICPAGYTVGCDAWTSLRISYFEMSGVSTYLPSDGETAKLCIPR